MIYLKKNDWWHAEVYIYDIKQVLFRVPLHHGLSIWNRYVYDSGEMSVFPAIGMGSLPYHRFIAIHIGSSDQYKQHLGLGLISNKSKTLFLGNRPWVGSYLPPSKDVTFHASSLPLVGSTLYRRVAANLKGYYPLSPRARPSLQHKGTVVTEAMYNWCILNS